MSEADDLAQLACAVIAAFGASGRVIVTAESCTGGLIAAALTDVPGSSRAFVQGFVTYSNEAKQAMLGVPAEYFSPAGPGAVSEVVARAMAEGAATRAVLPSGALGCVAVSVTGIAGPGGGSEEKPVGTVHLAVSDGRRTQHRACLFSGDRHAIRLASVREALQMLQGF